MIGILGNIIQATQALSALLNLVTEVVDAVETEAPKGHGDAKQAALKDTVSAVLDAADEMADDEEKLAPQTKEALVKLASKTGDVVVSLRNASGKYQTGGSNVFPPPLAE